MDTPELGVGKDTGDDSPSGRRSGNAVPQLNLPGKQFVRANALLKESVSSTSMA